MSSHDSDITLIIVTRYMFQHYYFIDFLQTCVFSNVPNILQFSPDDLEIGSLFNISFKLKQHFGIKYFVDTIYYLLAKKKQFQPCYALEFWLANVFF